MDGSPLRRGRPSGPCAVRRLAPRPRTVRLAGAVRRVGGGPARRPVPGLGRADAARQRPRLHRAEQGLASDTTRCAPSWRSASSPSSVNDVGGLPTLDEVLEVARRKSGNYTVRRPLEIGAAMAGCGDRLLTRLGGYGDAVGEAFQLRDDLLGIFGSPAITGKPVGADLTEHKATSVVVAAHHMADPTLRRQLTELMSTAELDEADVDRWRTPDRRDRRGPTDRRDDRRPAAPRIGMDRREPARRRGAFGAAQHGVGLHPAGGMMRIVAGSNRPRGGRRRRPRRPVGRTAPGRPRPCGDRRRTRRRPRRTGRPARHRRLSARHRTDGAHHAGPDRRDLRGRRRIHRRPARAGRRRPRLPRAVLRRQLSRCAQRPRRDGRRGRAVRRAATGAGLPAAARLAHAAVSRSSSTASSPPTSTRRCRC